MPLTSSSHPFVDSSIELATRQAERLQAAAFELYFVNRSSLKIESRELKTEALSRAQDVGMAVRILRKSGTSGRLGFSFTTSLHPQSIEKAIQSAWEIAAVMPEDPGFALAHFKQQTYRAPEGADQSWDQAGLNIPASDKIELARELESLCRKEDSRIKGVRTAAITESSAESWLIDSNGNRLYERGTWFTGRISCRAEQNGENQMGSDFGFSPSLSELDIKSVARNAAERATELLGATQAPTFIGPAVLRNSVVANLMGFLSSSFSAEEIDKGRSMIPFSKLGETIFSKSVTLVDDGLLSIAPGRGLGSSPFDAEGMPCQKTILVENGILKGGLYDLYYARKNGKTSTGNATRSIKSPPSIGTSNLYIENGSKSLENLIQNISHGVLITELMGLHTANSVTGDFSLGASGILIENGKLTRPVRSFAVAGNVLEIFRKISDVGNDLRFFGSTGAPSVSISEISVAGQ